MKKWKQKIAAVLVPVIFATLIPAGNVQAKSKDPAKLGAKDFVYAENGKKRDFLEQSKDGETWWVFCCVDADIRHDKKHKAEKWTTNRKVKLGSTGSYVKRQYGKTARKKVKKTEDFYKAVKYEVLTADISVWKSYLEYNYKDGSDRYMMRFYLDKKNKVTAIAFIKNLNKYKNYPNKEVDPGLTFQPPKGEKVTTEIINGKKVFMIPRGSKVKLKRMETSAQLTMYDVYGKIKRQTFVTSLRCGNVNGNDSVQNGKSYDFEEVVNATIASYGQKLNFNKLGKYLYFTLWMNGKESYNSKTGQYEYKTAPIVYYFKFK